MSAGYEGPVKGEEIYEEISDEIEDKEPGAYVFMSKKTDDTSLNIKSRSLKTSST